MYYKDSFSALLRKVTYAMAISVRGITKYLGNTGHRLLVHSDLKLLEDVIYQNKEVNWENKDM